MHTFLRCHLKTKGGLRSYVDILDIHRKKIFREIVKTHVYIVPAIFRKFWKYVIISLTSLAKDTWFLLGGATNGFLTMIEPDLAQIKSPNLPGFVFFPGR